MDILTPDSIYLYSLFEAFALGFYILFSKFGSRFIYPAPVALIQSSHNKYTNRRLQCWPI